MSNKHKVKGVLPHENTKADLLPWSYFRIILEHIEEASKAMEDSENDDGCQFLLVSIDLLILLCHKYPIMAAANIYRVKRKQLKSIFDAWWIRNEKKIPKKYREGILNNSKELFEALFSIQSWVQE